MEVSEERVGSGDEGRGPSVLLSLKERRQQVLKEQILSLPVPRWSDPAIVVKYQPVPHAFIRKAQSRLEKATKERRAELEIEANADILIHGCVAVVAVLDGREYSLRPGDPEGEPTTFDADLAENLGVEGSSARKVLRALFLTDGDIMSAATELIKFSGYRETEADAELLGE